MKQSYFKYIIALLLFGSNGIVANFISMNSYEIVLLRTLLGIFIAICTVGIIVVGYFFNAIQYLIV